MIKVPKSGKQEKRNSILLIELLIKKDKIIIFRIRIVFNLNIVHEFLIDVTPSCGYSRWKIPT